VCAELEKLRVQHHQVEKALEKETQSLDAVRREKDEIAGKHLEQVLKVEGEKVSLAAEKNKVAAQLKDTEAQRAELDSSFKTLTIEHTERVGQYGRQVEQLTRSKAEADTAHEHAFECLRLELAKVEADGAKENESVRHLQVELDGLRQQCEEMQTREVAVVAQLKADLDAAAQALQASEEKRRVAEMKGEEAEKKLAEERRNALRSQATPHQPSEPSCGASVAPTRELSALRQPSAAVPVEANDSSTRAEEGENLPPKEMDEAEAAAPDFASSASDKVRKANHSFAGRRRRSFQSTRACSSAPTGGSFDLFG